MKASTAGLVLLLVGCDPVARGDRAWEAGDMAAAAEAWADQSSLDEVHRARLTRALLQLSVADDPTKDGITAAEIPAMLEVAAEADVRVEGFMTIGVHGDAAASAAASIESWRIARITRWWRSTISLQTSL